MIVLSACFLVLKCILSAAISHGQVLSPLSGQGYPPGMSPDIGLTSINGSIDSMSSIKYPEVYVSCYLDRLLKVNEQEYGFEAVIFMRLSWSDPRALDEIYGRTAETYGVKKDRDCLRECHLQNRQCCDTVWLPGLDLVNTWGLPQERVDYELISVDAKNLTSVQWIRRFNGVFYTPMNFRRFPLDKQVLVIEFWGQACCHHLKKSSVANKIVTGRTDPDLSSWRVVNVSMETYISNVSDIVSAGTFSDPEEPYPIRPDGHSRFSFVVPYPDSLRIYINIERLSWYYVASYIIPVVLCVALSWWTFWISPRSIETRMSVLVALFLSLTALQFTISNQLPASSYMTAMGWVMIVSYILIVGATAETMLVYTVFRWYIHSEDRGSETEDPSASIGGLKNGSLSPTQGEPLDGITKGNHNPSAAADKRTNAVTDLATKDGTSQEGGCTSSTGDPGIQAGEATANSSPRIQRKVFVFRDLWSRTLSMRLVASTVSFSHRLESSLRRDLEKAKRVMTKIDSFAMWAFPLAYTMFLLIIFLAIK